MQHKNIRKGNWVRVIQNDGREALGKVHAAYLTGDQLFSVVVDGVFKNYRGHEIIGKVKKPV
jgi:hypothetical protein